jgi:hypothetical protein
MVRFDHLATAVPGRSVDADGALSVSRAEGSERRATVGDRHQQFEHRDYMREWDGRR